MAAGQKLIGICLSQAHSYLNANLIGTLNTEARKEGYRTVVFNSRLDFFWHSPGDEGAGSIFDVLDPALFSALVIPADSFHNGPLLDRIVSGAKDYGVPVFCLGAEHPDCISVLYDYKDAYKSLLRHVIRDHGARDPVFLSGLKEEPHSELRLRCFREVLEEEGLPFREEDVAWGEYWDQPTREALSRLLASRAKAPDAVFCANDSMALTAFEILAEAGLRVPEDVMVTGFDALPVSVLSEPQLTTIDHDMPSLARILLDQLRRIDAGENPAPVLHHSFTPRLRESCGCPRVRQPETLNALSIFQRSDMLSNHENQMYDAVQQILEHENSREMLSHLCHMILPNSGFYLNGSFLAARDGGEYTAREIEPELRAFIRVPAGQPVKEASVLRRGDLALLNEVRPGITILTAIHSEKTVCGVYATYTEHLETESQLIRRMNDMLNLLFTILLGNIRRQRLLRNLENSLYTDPLSGVDNLKGLTRWFQHYCNRPENHEKWMAFSIYSIYRYTYLFETYGIGAVEEIVHLVADSLRISNPEALAISRIAPDQFVIVNDAEQEEKISRIIDRSVQEFFERRNAFNASAGKPYFLEVNCGCTLMPKGWTEPKLENLIKLATGEMYLNRMRAEMHEPTTHQVPDSAALYNRFRLLIDRNLFLFHFQPIVDARRGQIFAYEALMRTDELIGMNPLEILETAREYDQLYAVEKATLFGIMDRFTREFSHFHGSRVFINTIPGHFLSREDCDRLVKRFEGYLDCFVFELTEQDATTDEELDRLKSICKPGHRTQIAIDDYGSGHSNMVNLLRYAPQIIKIDRMLISGIQSDSNKQLFLQNTVAFAHQNGIKALAEGVETLEELQTVIRYGVDLIQGFYTGRPTENPVMAINENVRDQILEENLLRSKSEVGTLVYNARDGETIPLFDLAMKNYASVLISGGLVTLSGESGHTVEMIIRVADHTSAHIVLDRVNLKGLAEPTVQLGTGSSVTIELRGDNVLNKEGIRVPAGSVLRLIGDGNLLIHNNRNYAVGIGASYNDPYGTLILDLSGSLRFTSAGDKVVCLGGGRSDGDGIHFLRGIVEITANGISVVCVGSSAGTARVLCREGVSLSAHAQGNDVVGIGTMGGHASLSLNGALHITADSERAAGIGTMNGSADILIEGGSIDSVIHCDSGTCLGSLSGEATVTCRSAQIHIHGEGNRISGLGSLNGVCRTRIESGHLSGSLLAGERLLLGNRDSRLCVTGGNIQLFPEGGETPEGPDGEPLYYRTPEEDHFEQTFRRGDLEWIYIADRDAEGRLGVFIPE